MKTILAVLALTLALVPPAFAKDVYVKGHTTKNGAYIEPHHRSSPDSYKGNNYGTQGNMNPYTGKPGTESPYSSPSTPKKERGTGLNWND